MEIVFTSHLPIRLIIMCFPILYHNVMSMCSIIIIINKKDTEIFMVEDVF